MLEKLESLLIKNNLVANFRLILQNRLILQSKVKVIVLR